MESLDIIYQDAQIVVVNKPPGLVSTPAETHSGVTLADILNSDYGISLDRGGLVHRLDKDTSGIILAAKTSQGFENLQNQFRNRQVKKTYLVLVHGLTPEQDRVEVKIGRNPIKRDKFSVLDEGRESSTDYKLKQHLSMDEEEMKRLFGRIKDTSYGHFSLLECKPQTGRTHQIRVHLKYINHPIVSDERYVGRKTHKLDIKWCPRMFLHAHAIEFNNPTTGKEMSFMADLPADLTQALRYLE